jgi:hypothetical protein
MSDDEQQRVLLDEPSERASAIKVVRGLFEVLQDNVLRDRTLINYTLFTLDGMLEDNRERVRLMVDGIMNDFKDSLDLIKILTNLIKRTNEQVHRDVASHILVLIIE